MRKILLILMPLVVLGVFIFQGGLSSKQSTSQPSVSVSPTKVPNQTVRQRSSIFVPYWSVGKESIDVEDYDQVIYFGITPTRTGINKQDAGYLRLAQFVEQTPNASTLLTLRMLDDDINSAVLKDPIKQKAIIQETIAIAQENGFDGVVLNLELSSLPFESIIQQINSFTKTFAQEVKEQDMEFAITVYGDTFYRIRPFEVQTLEDSVDQVMIMAYDLHKANGNPGPNFPLKGKETYGYDYEKLTEQFLTHVPASKITVIFGLFGYDWPVDEKNISQSIGKARSMLEIQTQIVDKCAALECTFTRETKAGEAQIRYTAEDGSQHTVWYEDLESISAKQAFLKQKGIQNFSYWAYSYF